MPVSANIGNVVVSNCVLNLVLNKAAVFKDIFRVIKPGGHFNILDVVIVGNLPDALRNDAEMYPGCVAGAIRKTNYLDLITTRGFENVIIQKEMPITIPGDILEKYLNAEELNNFKQSDTSIFSITVYAEKPVVACCPPGCC